MNPNASILNASPDSQATGNVLALLGAHQNALQGGGQQPSPAPQPAPAPTDNSGGGGIMGWLGRNASTIGAIGGGIAGELVDPFGGGIIGASLGSGAGKAVQNRATNQDIGSGVLGAGVEGGLGQAAGFGIGKLLGGVGGKLIGSAAKSVAKAAPSASEQAAKAASDAVAKTKAFNAAFGGFEKQNEPVRQMLEGHGVDTDLTNAGASANEASQNLRGKAHTLANAIASPIQRIRDEETLKAAPGGTVTLDSKPLQDAIKEINSQKGPIGEQSTFGPKEVSGKSGAQTQLEASGLVPKTKTATMKSSGKNPVVNTAQDLTNDIKNSIESPGPNGEPGLKINTETGEITGQVSIPHALNILKQIGTITDKHYGALSDSSGREISGSEKKITSGILNKLNQSLEDQIYNQPGLLKGIQGRAAEAAQETRDTLTKAGFDNDQIDKALKTQSDLINSKSVVRDSTAERAGGEQSNDIGSKLSPLISNARIASGAKKVAAGSGAAREKVESTAATVAKQPTETAAKGSPALGVFHATPGGPIAKTLAAVGAHTYNNPALRAGAGNVLSNLSPTAGGDITKSGMGLGALGAATATGPLVNAPANAAPPGQFTNQTGAEGVSAMQPPAQTAQPNPMGSAMLNYALFNPQLLSTMLSTANQQSQQNYAGQQAQSALSGLPAAPSGLGAELETMGPLNLGSAGAYNTKVQQVAQQIAAALPGTDADSIAKQLTNYMGGGASIEQAQQSLLQQLQLQQQQTTSGLSSLLAPSGLTQQPAVGMTPSLSTVQ